MEQFILRKSNVIKCNKKNQMINVSTIGTHAGCIVEDSTEIVNNFLLKKSIVP